jgi:excisionase family DNA binding protein
MQPKTSKLAALRSPSRRGRRSRTLTVAQTAALLDITKESTFRLIREGAIPAHRHDGRIEVRRAAFAYMAEVQS